MVKHQRAPLTALATFVVVAFRCGLSQASAALVTWQFVGEVTFVRDDDDVLGGLVSVGTPFSGSYNFESTTADTAPADPTSAFYIDAITDISGDLGSLSFAGLIGPNNYITVLNDHATSQDSYGLRAGVDLLAEPVEFRLKIKDFTEQAFADDSLLLIPPRLDAFQVAQFEFFSEVDTFDFHVTGTISALIPEPATLLLLAFGSIFALKRFRRVNSRLGCDRGTHGIKHPEYTPLPPAVWNRGRLQPESTPTR